MNEQPQTEEINIKKLPYQYLLGKHQLEKDQLSPHTQQLISDLKKTTNLLVNASKEGEINMTKKTEQKIRTYDRYICDGIFEFLEDRDIIAKEKAEQEEQKKAYMENMEQGGENPTEQPQSQPETQPEQPEEKEEKENSDTKFGLGFWDWK